MDTSAEAFVKCHRLAIVGVSRNGKGFGNMALRELKARGYDTSIVHPQATEIGGDKCYSSLGDLQGRVDGVFISVPPEKALGVIREAYASGINNVWLQRGAESKEVLETAKALGLDPVAGKCILMYAQPVKSIHNFHRAVDKVLGKL